MTTKYRRFGSCSFPAIGDPSRNNGPKTDWHGACKGALRNGNGALVVCECECHGFRPLLCLDCGYADHTRGEQVDLTTRTCYDAEACRDRVATRRATSPVLRMIADTIERALNAPPPPAARPSRPRPRSAGFCEHCGEPTRGGRFKAGHDAKLKGELMRAVQSGDAAARAEQSIRGWTGKGHAYTDHPLDAAARILVERAGGERAFLAVRVKERTGGH